MNIQIHYTLINSITIHKGKMIDGDIITNSQLLGYLILKDTLFLYAYASTLSLRYLNNAVTAVSPSIISNYRF